MPLEDSAEEDDQENKAVDADPKEHRADPALRRALEALDEVTQTRPNLNSFTMDRCLGTASSGPPASVAARSVRASPSILESVRASNIPAAQIDCLSSRGLATPRDSAEAERLYAQVEIACFSTDAMLTALAAPKPAERRSRQPQQGRRNRALSVERSSGLAAPGGRPPLDALSVRSARGLSYGREMQGVPLPMPVAPLGPPPANSTPRRRPVPHTVDTSRAFA